MTAHDVITVVRELLKDNFVGSYRWSDNEMMVKLTEASVELSRRRSDALFTDTVPTTMDIVPVTTLRQKLQINDFYREALAFYVCARCLDRDVDDTTNAQLAEYFRKNFYRTVG